MVKLLYFITTITILALVNFISSSYFHLSFIDLALPVGVLGILATAPNNFLTDYFNSQPYMEVEPERHTKFGKAPIFASSAYTLYAVVFIFIYYRSYFF